VVKRGRILLPGLAAMALLAWIYAYPWPAAPRVWASIMSGPLASLWGLTRFDPDHWIGPGLLALLYLPGLLADPVKQTRASAFISVLGLFIWFFTGLMVTIHFRLQ